MGGLQYLQGARYVCESIAELLDRVEKLLVY